MPENYQDKVFLMHFFNNCEDEAGNIMLYYTRENESSGELIVDKADDDMHVYETYMEDPTEERVFCEHIERLEVSTHKEN